MSIKVKCSSCGGGFSAKDSLAGRRVKCPKCKEPITIPAEVAPVSVKPPKAAPVAHNPLLDLLDEQNVRAVARGPVCENCGGELKPGAVVCIECGYNQETGDQLETEAFDDDIDAGAESSMSDADRIMAKAEKEIDDVPVTADGQNFGDGADSFLIAGVAFIIGAILIGIGLVIIFMMDTIGNYINSAFISLLASGGLYFGMGLWISIVAFMQKPGHGIGCILTGFVWCIVYGFMQGKTLLLPTIVLIASLVIGAASGAYVSFKGIRPPPEDARLFQSIESNSERLAHHSVGWRGMPGPSPIREVHLIGLSFKERA